jgi:hypothetical protein
MGGYAAHQRCDGAKNFIAHGLDVQEIRREIQAVPGLTYSSHVHPEYGFRALILVKIRADKVLAVLFPTDDPEVWNLGSAYRV